MEIELREDVDTAPLESKLLSLINLNKLVRSS